jgi:stearoyl-CoA desaturase (delta-9 desaturase)
LSSIANQKPLIERLFLPRIWIAQGIQLCGLIAGIWAVFSGVSMTWWLLTLAVYFATCCLGMAVCVHRGICHKAFKMNRSVERLFLLFSAVGMVGSPLGWVGTHRTHHAHADTDGDPHSPSIQGWKLLWTGPESQVEWWRMRDVLRDPFQRTLHQYYLLVAITWALLLLLIDPIAVIFGFLIPAGLQITASNLLTILTHGTGYRNFDTPDKSTNHPLMALLTWGEGWHNNHHADPRNWTTSKRWWELDVAGLCVRALSVIGLIDHRDVSEAAN